MIDTYAGGYFKALLDLRNFLEPRHKVSQTCNTKKKYAAMVQSLLELLTEDSEARECFLAYGGACWVKQAPDGSILAIGDRKDGVKNYNEKIQEKY